MSERIFFILIIHIIAALLLENIPHVHCKDCLISRQNRDLLTVLVNRTSCAPSNNPCYKFGGILLLTNSQCVCICPASKPTYMESTNRCSAYKDVWSKCNLSFRRKSSAIPIFSTVFYTSLRLNIPKQFRSCKIEADRKNSFYLSGSGWNKVPQKYIFPFLVETRTFRKRLKLTYVKWKTKVPPELVGRVFRLGITCGKQSDCVTLKISGKAFDQCILPPTTMIPASSRPSFIPSERTTPTKYVITTVQQVIPSTYTQPSVSNNGRRESSSSVKIPWSVIGTVIGILVVLLLSIVILAVCFWRRRKKLIQKNRNGNASSQSSGMTLSSSGSQPEVTYASPHHHHPYQELKPPVSGTPRGTYQPLMRNAKEDSSGYMLPSESTANNSDPLYNEIGSPLRSTLPPIYDYALPEDTVRISQHLSNTDLELNKLPKHNARNDADYVGRTTQDQEDSESPSLEGAALAPLGDDLVSPSYLDFTCEEDPNQKDPSNKSINSDSKAPKQAPGSSRYKKPVNVPKNPRKPVSGPKSPFKKGSPKEFTYQVLTSPSTPANEPLRLRENPEDGYNKDSTA